MPNKITAKALIDAKCVLFSPDNPFTLASGRKSPVYVDVRRLISYPQERASVMDLAADKLKNINCDVLAGGETAGIPYAAFIADRLNAPMVYVRKKPKGHGRLAQIEGELKQNSNAILVEDMQTDGGSKRLFVDALRDAGAIVEHAFVVFHYGIFQQSIENMEKAGITLHALATWWDVIDAARKDNTYDDDTISKVEEFLHNPEGWKA